MSSDTYLKRLATDVVKIDQSFIRNIVHDQKDQIIIRKVIQTAQALGREVVAEGLEPQEHLALLIALDCNCGQGYAIARPMPVAEFNEWLSRAAANQQQDT